MRLDNRGEYTSKEFDGFCRQEGLKRQLTVSYTPEKNGVVERKNRSIVGASRAMLHDQSLPFFLWDEACSTAIYLLNRSPHRVVGNMIHGEFFSRKKPKVIHFQIFGILTYSHVPSEKRTKLEPTTEKGIDYDETFVLVAQYTSIRSLISIAAEMSWKIHQMDVNTAFLNGISQEEIYVEQPQELRFMRESRMFAS